VRELAMNGACEGVKTLQLRTVAVEPQSWQSCKNMPSLEQRQFDKPRKTCGHTERR
jgi:hypothetical protein